MKAKFPESLAILSAWLLLLHPCQGSTTVHVNLNTSVLIGSSAGPFSLDLQLNDANGGSVTNELAVVNFQFGGGAPSGGPVLTGGATGSLGTSVAVADSSIVNEFSQTFTPGTNLAFDISFTANPVTGDTPEGIFIAINDRSSLPIPTQAGTNFDELVKIELDSTNPALNVYASDPTRAPAGGGSPLQFTAPTYTTTGSCTWTINPTNQTFSAGGGTGTITVTGLFNCVWGAASATNWICVSSNNSGTGNGSVDYSVAPNADTNSRVGLMLIAGQRFEVNQAGAVYSFGDGIPDWWRQKYFGTSNTTNSASCATCDADGTGQHNLEKFLAGLNPTNSESVFRILSLNQQDGNIFVTWEAGAGRSNVVQAVNGPLGPTNPFIDISPLIVLPGSGDVITNYLDSGAGTNESLRFYRLRIGP